MRPDGTVAPWLTYDRHVAILRGLWEHHPPAVYPRVTAPVLLVPAGPGPAGAAGTDTGEPDSTARKRHDVEAALAALPNARVRWVAGDHDLHAQHPHELADAMLDMAADGFFA